MPAEDPAAYEDPEEQLDEEADLPASLRYERDIVARLADDGRLINAARVAATFGLDPVTVLDESDRLKRLVRLAAARVIDDDHRREKRAEAAEQARLRQLGR